MQNRAGFSFRLIAVVSLVAALSSCAGRPEGVLIPTASASVPGASTVDVLVATTRKTSDTPGVLFSGERGKAVSYTHLTLPTILRV